MRNSFFILFFLLLLFSCVSLKTSHSDIREKIVRIAKNLLEKKYSYGKQDVYQGFDCSGFTQFVYKEVGIKIPRTSFNQYENSRKISLSELEKGDLIFFSISSNKPDHVGIYIGEKKFIHSPSEGKKIQISSFDNDYWKKRIYGAGTYL
ncbi:MAG: C40 family peptidase [Candidatus Goldbacteria bacterium]|nr:C40 family peptidase [Candidatus Goldiibacteriota bacterium]